MGHMLDHTIMDACVRWHRMCGDNTLWLPGVDHAGIATQMVVERMLAEEGITRQQLGREKFECRVWQWKEKYGNRITDQMKAIGDSVDWSRESFTLSPQLSIAVREAFVRLHERGLIIAALIWSTGARAARPRSPILKPRTKKLRAASGTFATRSLAPIVSTP